MEQAYIKVNGEWKGIYSTYRALFLKGTYESLLTPAPMKDYLTVDNRLEHGTRYLASSELAKKKERQVTIKLFIDGLNEEDYLSRYSAFLDAITVGIFEMKVPRLKRIYKFVYTNCTQYGNFGVEKGNFALKLIEPNPEDREEIKEEE